MGDTMIVRIRGLVLTFSIGVLDFERVTPQTVIFNIDMRVEDGLKPTEEAQDYVSYSPVVDHLTALSESGRHIDLVEQLADEVFDFLFVDQRISGATVEIMKPDIFPQVDSVGIVISRSNPVA